MNRPLKFGQVRGPEVNIDAFVGATEVFLDLSGHFMIPDGVGNLELADASSTNITGWMRHDEETIGATEGVDGGEKTPINVAKDAVYLIPACGLAGVAVTEAQLKAVQHETCDIQMVNTNYQYADIVTSSVDILLIVGYRYYASAAGMQAVEVMINWEKIVNTGVA